MLQTCPACGAATPGKYCTQCGTPIGGGGGGGAAFLGQREQRTWRVAAIVALLSLIGVIALVVRSRQAEPPSPPASAEASPLFSLDGLTGRARFDSLYNLVMRSAENGDTLTVARFAPIAFRAYSELEAVDTDARYHAAVLRLHVQGDTSAALGLADSILAASPSHLFGFLIRGTAARLTGNDPVLRRAQADFLRAWPGETTAGRPEYRDHQTMLDQFRSAAEEQRGK